MHLRVIQHLEAVAVPDLVPRERGDRRGAREPFAKLLENLRVMRHRRQDPLRRALGRRRDKRRLLPRVVVKLGLKRVGEHVDVAGSVADQTAWIWLVGVAVESTRAQLGGLPHDAIALLADEPIEVALLEVDAGLGWADEAWRHALGRPGAGPPAVGGAP